jgi:ribosomal protein L19E
MNGLVKRERTDMKDFPIDSRGEIGKKRVKVPSMMIDKMEESILRETIRKIVREQIWSRK